MKTKFKTRDLTMIAMMGAIWGDFVRTTLHNII